MMHAKQAGGPGGRWPSWLATGQLEGVVHVVLG